MIEEIVSLKDQVSGPAKAMQGSVGGLSSSFAEMLGPAGLVVGAVAAVGAAFGGLVLAGASLALEQSQLKNQMLATFSAMAGGPEAGKATLDMVNTLSETLPQSRQQIADWTKTYMAMGVTDTTRLQGQIKATASAVALMGDEGGQAYESITRKVQEAALAHQGFKLGALQLASLSKTGANMADVATRMGLSTAQLTAKLKAGTVDATKFGDALQASLIDKGGGALATMGASLSVQWDKFKESIGRLFEDVDPGPFLGAMKDLLGVFSQATPSGQAMKAGVTGFFNTVFSLAGKVIPVIRHFFLDMVIWALKAYVGLKPFISGIVNLVQKGGIMAKVMLAFKAALYVVGAAVAVVVGGIGLFVAAIVGIGVAVAAAVGSIIEFVRTAIGALSGWASSGAQMAGDFVQGLIDGITAGVGKAVQAVKDLGSSVMGGIKGVLGIHSPSIEMMKLGGHTAGGFAAGIEQGTGAVGGAAQSMAGAANDNAISPSAYRGAAGASGAAGPAGAAGAGGGVNVVVEAGAIVIQGAGKGAEELTEEAVSLVFERVALAQGA